MKKSIMRNSKYDNLVGKIFSGAKLVETRMVDKTSKKTGKEYRVRRFWMTADGVHTLEIGTQSFKNESYFKRLDKITTEWIYSDGWFKEEDEVEFKVDSFEDTIKESVDEWYSNWRKQKEVEDLHDACFSGKDVARHSFEHICQLIREDDNMDVHGQTIWNTKEDLFKGWNDIKIDSFTKNLEREKEDSEFVWGWSYKFATLKEWETEFSKKLWDFICDEWENLEERRRKAQKEWRDKVFGAGWEERWERKNFGSIDMRVNKYDEVFKDLTPKEAKRKMRELSKLLHPDVHPELDGKEFTEMHSAYERHMSRVA